MQIGSMIPTGDGIIGMSSNVFQNKGGWFGEWVPLRVEMVLVVC